MICAIHTLGAEPVDNNLENNFHILKDIVKENYLFSKTENFCNNCKFENVFITKNKSENNLINFLEDKKILHNVFNYLNHRKFKVGILIPSYIKLNINKKNIILKYLEEVKNPCNDDFIYFENNEKKINYEVLIFRIDRLCVNTCYFDCNPNEFISRTQIKTNLQFWELLYGKSGNIFTTTKNLDSLL